MDYPYPNICTFVMSYLVTKVMWGKCYTATVHFNKSSSLTVNQIKTMCSIDAIVRHRRAERLNVNYYAKGNTLVDDDGNTLIWTTEENLDKIVLPLNTETQHFFVTDMDNDSIGVNGYLDFERTQSITMTLKNGELKSIDDEAAVVIYYGPNHSDEVWFHKNKCYRKYAPDEPGYIATRPDGVSCFHYNSEGKLHRDFAYGPTTYTIKTVDGVEARTDYVYYKDNEPYTLFATATLNEIISLTKTAEQALSTTVLQAPTYVPNMQALPYSPQYPIKQASAIAVPDSAGLPWLGETR